MELHSRVRASRARESRARAEWDKMGRKVYGDGAQY